MPNLIAELSFDAASGFLVGVIGDKHFHMRAVSGGGRGSTVPGVAQKSLRSYLATTPLIKDGRGNHVERGGTLPPGRYGCVYFPNHQTFHECVWLDRDGRYLNHFQSPFAMHPIYHHRGNDFFIHGRGELGSDGCIVPAHPHERISLNHAIRDFAGHVYLTVRGVSYMLPAERFDGSLA